MATLTGVTGATTLYDRLGCRPDADERTLRSAYRELAKQLHPDTARSPSGPAAMAAVNEAWTVLSDPTRRAAYDRTLIDLRDRVTINAAATVTFTPAGGDQARGSRRDAWYAGMRVQIVRLTREAARSASMALAIKRHGKPRAIYEARIDTLVAHNLKDTADRIRAARAAGAAPLDLALVASLVGLGDLAVVTATDARRGGVTGSHEATAELIDRTWDNLAHGVSHEVETALGSNPHLARHLRDL